MPKPGISAPSLKLFQALVDEFASADSGITRSQMMGMPCLKVRGKMFAGYWQGAMVFKLSGDEHKQALALKGAHLFDPSDMNRPMKEWVVVPYAHKPKWRSLAQGALDYVASKT
jgi:hypothetical protein